MSDKVSADDSDDVSEADLSAKLEYLSPVMNLLNQAREAVAGSSQSASARRKSHLQFKPPTRLGDFELLTPIGRGGMGVVYEARQRSLDRIVALKVLPKSVLPETEIDSRMEPTEQQNLVKRFHVEARAAGRLHHTNIVSVYGFGEDEGFYYFVMQRIYGKSLQTWIQLNHNDDSQKLPPHTTLARTAAKFGFQAASALAYAHGEGILHRDVKPANLLIDEDENLQVTDFGIARIDDSEALTKTSDVVGTLRYMAPEQVLGDSTAQSDIYSLGVTLYEMLTGKPAMDEAAIRSAVLLKQRPSGPSPLRVCKPDLPIDLCTIVDKAMMPDAVDRYASAGDLADDLHRFLEGNPIKARRMPWWEQSIRWVKANQAVSVLASIVVLALSLAAAVSVWGRIQISQALDDEKAAKRSAESTAQMATAALEEIFSRYSLSADAASIAFDATDFSAPPVDPKTVSLMQELLVYYDTLAARRSEGSSSENSQDASLARMNLATIYSRLGKYDQAIEAFQDSARELGGGDPLMLARIQNQIGIALQLSGRHDDSREYHQQALDLLRQTDQLASAETRFEIARTKLLSSRRLRPGMGPQAMPPVEAFLFNPRRGDLDRNPLVGRRKPAEPPSMAGLDFFDAVGDLAQLQRELPESIPVKLLLADMVRELLGDIVAARFGDSANRPILDVADRLIDDLESVVERQLPQGNDAAARYELVQLLTDFSVFRRMRDEELVHAERSLDQALPHIENLIKRFPNVEAYDNLAVHTWFKSAMIGLRNAPMQRRRPEVAMQDSQIRLQQALEHQRHLLERTPGAKGYSMWCSLFLMRMGDLQDHADDMFAASRNYQRALRMIPRDRYIEPKVRQVEAEDFQRVCVATLILLDRLARVSPPQESKRARELVRRFGDPDVDYPRLFQSVTDLLAESQD